MSKHRWRESLQCLRENYIDPANYEQLKLSKIEIQNRVIKVQKFLNDRRHNNRKNRNGEGNSKRESEIFQLVEDLSEQYLFVYDLLSDLRKALLETYNEITTEDGFYTASSDSSSETSEDHSPSSGFQLESRNQEVEDLKQKLTIVAQENECLNSKHMEAQRKIEQFEDEFKQLKDNLRDKEGELSEFVGMHEARHKEALILIKDLEAQVERLSYENRQLKEQTEYELNAINQMQIKECELEKAMKDKEDEFSAMQPRIKGLESDLSCLEDKKRELEEQILSKFQENSSLKDEVGGLLEKITNLEAMVQIVKSQADKGDQSSMSIQMLALTREVNQLQQEVDVKRNDEIKTLHEEKEVLERKLLELEITLARREDKIAKLNRKLLLSENESSTRIGLLNTQMETFQQQMSNEREKSTQRISLLEKQNNEFTIKVSDQQMRLRQQEDTINSLRADCKLAKSRLLQAADRKMEELAEEFRKSFEANIRILRQRIRVAEEVQTENKETCKSIKERCEQDHLGLEKKVQEYSQMIAKNKGEVINFFNASNGMLDGFQSLFDRFEDKEGDFSSRISRVLDDITVMKNWVKVTTNEMKPAKDESPSGGTGSFDMDDDKVRLMRGMYELQRKVAQLEKCALEKEEEVLKLVEEKKEAIRQLCISVEYHQSRCDQLIKLLNKGKGRY